MPSNVWGSLMSSDRKQVRLLTFDRLPDRAFVPEVSGIGEALDRLSTQAICFENHYLQAQGIDSLLGASQSATKPNGLAAQMMSQGVGAAALFHGSVTGLAEFTSQLPDGFSVFHLSEACKTISGGLSSGDIQSLKQCGFVWVHCELSTLDAGDDSIVRVVENHVAWCTDSGSDVSESLAIITALFGAAPPEETRFESKLFEGQILVPLWVLVNGIESSRVQTITGSFDVALTVIEALSGSEFNVVSSMPELRGAQDLRNICIRESDDQSRAIRIRFGSVTAIRTSEFLFVNSGTHDDVSNASSSTDIALFAKPRDVWNLNDVSAEYMQVVQEFADQIR